MNCWQEEGSFNFVRVTAFAATVDQDVLCGQLMYCWCLAEGHSSFVESFLRLDKGSLGDVWQYLPAEVRQASSPTCVVIIKHLLFALVFESWQTAE